MVGRMEGRSAGGPGQGPQRQAVPNPVSIRLVGWLTRAAAEQLALQVRNTDV